MFRTSRVRRTYGPNRLTAVERLADNRQKGVNGSFGAFLAPR
jgi:hypothetical protein